MSAHLTDEVLSAHLDGAEGGGDRQAVLAHLSACATCAHRRDLMEATARAIAGLPDESLPAPLDLGFLAPVRAADPLVLPTGRRWRPPAWAAPVLAAAAVLVVAASIGPGLLAGRGASSATSSSKSAADGGGLSRGLAPEAGGAAPGTATSGGVPASPGTADNANGAPVYSTSSAPHAARAFPQAGGATVDLASSDPSPRAGQTVSLGLSVRASTTSVQVRRTTITVRRGNGSQVVLAGGSEDIPAGQTRSESTAWDAGKLSSGPETPGDYTVDGNVELADGTILRVSISIRVR